MARFKHEKQGEESYDLSMYQDDHRSSSNHILIVMQSVDRRDIEAKTLLSKEVMPTFKACIKFSRQHALRITDKFNQPTFCVVNFNQRRHLHLPPELRAQEEARFARRVHEIIQKIKPHKVLVSGDQAMKAMHPTLKDPQLKRGWLHRLQYGERTLPTVSTLDFARLLENDGQQGNMLGFWGHHLANLIVGYNPYDISKEMKISPRYVDTDEKFKYLLGKLRTTKSVAIDTETRSLSVHNNAIYMIQFCFAEDKHNQYLVPLNHPTTPLSQKQSREWSRQLRSFFHGDRSFFHKKYAGEKRYHPNHRIHQVCENHELPELIFFNGSFDLRVIRTVLDVQIVPHYVWEIRAGEHLLDENAIGLKFFGTPSGGLEYVSHYYGSDAYRRPVPEKWDDGRSTSGAGVIFGKGERDTCGQVAPTDPGLWWYTSLDVAHLQHIREKQILRASHQLIGTKSYAPYFKNHMRHIMGETEHQLSRMRQCGSAIDVEYLRHLVSDQSPLKLEIHEKEEELKAYDSVQSTNTHLLTNSGFNGQGLWGEASSAAKWLFTPSKPAHRVALFIDQLKLDPVDFTDKGAPAIDKNFIEQYKMSVAEVETYAEHQEIDKLYGTYARGWLKRLRTTVDGVTDYTLRPDYSYMGVTTGRLASYDPSLQVIPQRGRAAKLIKRAFVARKGYILLKFDFSAHEIRFWSIVSGDQAIANNFRKGQALRKQWILTPTDEIKKKLKTDGDVHLGFVKSVFNKVVEKSDPLRDAVKRAVFGTVYGLGAASLGEQTKAADIVALKDKIVSLRKEKKECSDAVRIKQIDKEISEQLRLMAKIRAEDREAYAQDIMDKLLAGFPKGAAWLERMKRQAVENLHVFSPFGRIRHLYAALIQEKAAQSKQVRRGVNAPIQGVASEQGTEGNRAIDKTYYMEAPIIAKELGLDVEHASKMYVQRIVHDASYFMVPIDMVIPLLHIMLHEATYGSKERVKKYFGLDYTVEPEVEAEFGMDDSNSYKFDFSMKSLVECIGESIKDGERLGLLDCSPKEAMRRAFAPWLNKNTRNYLHKRFPLLNVPEAVNVVPDALKMAREFSFAKEAA